MLLSEGLRPLQGRFRVPHSILNQCPGRISFDCYQYPLACLSNQVRPGNPEVHQQWCCQSTSVSPSQRLMLNNIQGQFNLQVGMAGAWNSLADARLLELLEKPKKKRGGKALAIEDTDMEQARLFQWMPRRSRAPTHRRASRLRHRH